MKKIIATALALVMILAVSVPAFAVDINQGSASKEANVDVKTSYDEQADTWYTVSIPADTSIPWNQATAKDVSYQVACQLATGKKLQVTVTSQNGNSLNSTSGSNDKLSYAAAGFGAQTFEAKTGEKTSLVAPSVPVTLTVSGWNSVPVGEYKDTLTYTVAVI